MVAALGLAGRALGSAWPNPAVGCVLVQPRPGGSRVVGRGWTQPGGRPHAETEALGRAGGQAFGATAYVTLEPCSHHGQTPPCTEALVAAGIARAVIAMRDPDPRVDGRGIARLQAAGVAVTVGLREAEARTLNAGFISRIRRGRPMVTLKLATTLDGRIASRHGFSQWITGETARAWGHGLRASHDAIMIGSTTALTDDPLLTCRLPGLAQRSPVRVVLDSRLRLPLTARLVASAKRQPTWLVTLRHGDPMRLDAYRQCGVEVLEVAERPTGVIDLERALAALGQRGLTRLLVEGGSHLAAALIRADLVDRLEWFRAASLMGADGLAAVQPFGVDRLDQQALFERVAVRPAGEDIMESYRRRAGE